MNFSVPIMSPTAFDHVSLVASYHCFKKVNGSAGTAPPADSFARASSIISSHCVVSPSGSAPGLGALFQTSVVASNQCFHASCGSISPAAPALNCSWAVPFSHELYRPKGSTKLSLLPLILFFHWICRLLFLVVFWHGNKDPFPGLRCHSHLYQVLITGLLITTPSCLPAWSDRCRAGKKYPSSSGIESENPPNTSSRLHPPL